jgi:hypothetical protein
MVVIITSPTIIVVVVSPLKKLSVAACDKVITAVPNPIIVTFPRESTEATVLSEEE